MIISVDSKREYQCQFFISIPTFHFSAQILLLDISYKTSFMARPFPLLVMWVTIWHGNLT